MNRNWGLALVAAGCALAAGAASTGPFLEADRTVPTFESVLRRDGFGIRVVRPGSGSDSGRPTYDWLGAVFQYIATAVLVALVLWGAYRLVQGLLRLRGLRLGSGAARHGTNPYDPGDEIDDDAETLLRRRVADDLRLLSADLDETSDARELVIACYARMEASLAAAGTPRAATETPLELMARVLDSYDVPQADVRRLTALFTHARFSSHPVTGEMRVAARRSLAAVADALEVRA